MFKKVTVDVESDWGGRSESTLGLKYGVPKLLDLFDSYGVRALFFISTELLKDYRKEIKAIKDRGHELGSHGHFHVVYNSVSRAKQDMEISKVMIESLTGMKYPHYRAPKFSFDNGDVYANRNNHTGLLRYVWGLDRLKDILYLHPFDIIDAHQDAPNLFCRAWYSRPRLACKTLCRLLAKA